MPDTLDISVDELNKSADYLAQNNLLFGKIKPIFRKTVDGKFELVMENIKTSVEKLKLDPNSVEALNMQDEYLLDAQNAMKRAKAYHPSK